MRPEILSEFLWGPPISRGAYQESQRPLWSRGHTTTAEVQNWQMSMSAARTREHQPLQGLVLKSTHDAKVLALRWAVDRPGRPGWVVHGVTLPTDTPAAEALALADSLRLDDAGVEAAYKRHADPPRPTPAAPTLDGIDCGVVDGIRRALLEGAAPVAVMGANEPQIRAHMAAALATLPTAMTAGTTLSTLESRLEPGLDLVGVIEPLWSGRRPLLGEFAEVLRVGAQSHHPRWLAGALASDAFLAYLRDAHTREEYDKHETAVIDFFENRTYHRQLVHALLRSGEIAVLGGRVNTVEEIGRVLAQGQRWALQYLSGHPGVEVDLAGQLAQGRSEQTDEFLSAALQAMSPGALRSFWSAVAAASHGRRDVHPGCGSHVCSVLTALDQHVEQDPDLREHLQKAAPELLPVQLRPWDYTIRAVLCGRTGPEEAAPLLGVADAAPRVAQAAAQELAAGAQPRMLAALLLALLNSNPRVEARTHLLLMGRDETFDFAAGPYLEALTGAVSPHERPAVILQRLFHPESAAYRRWGLPRNASTYLSACRSPGGPRPDTGVPEVAVVDRLLKDRQAANALLGDALVGLPHDQAAAVFWRHRHAIAAQYAIPSGSPLLAAEAPAESERRMGTRRARSRDDLRRVAPLTAASVFLVAALGATAFAVSRPGPAEPPAPAVTQTTPGPSGGPTQTAGPRTVPPDAAPPCAPPYKCPRVDIGSTAQ